MTYNRDYDRYERESEREGDRLIKCAHCQGDGWNYNTSFQCCANHNGVSTTSSQRKVKCCACNGRGVLPA